MKSDIQHERLLASGGHLGANEAGSFPALLI